MDLFGTPALALGFFPCQGRQDAMLAGVHSVNDLSRPNEVPSGRISEHLTHISRVSIGACLIILTRRSSVKLALLSRSNLMARE
jgi:hypothetical protein